jgi:hypothetical protein
MKLAGLPRMRPSFTPAGAHRCASGTLEIDMARNCGATKPVGKDLRVTDRLERVLRIALVSSNVRGNHTGPFNIQRIDVTDRHHLVAELCA